MTHTPADLRAWAATATARSLSRMLASTVCRMALIATGERHSRRDDATVAILRHQRHGQEQRV